jgi:glycosyltransferase involved in cell wall biosynthesis
VQRVRERTGLDLTPLARSAGGILQKPAKGFVHPPTELAVEMQAEATVRAREMFGRVMASVDLFLAPSRFLRDRFVREWGVHEAKIELLRFGVDLDSFRAVQRTRAEKLRVAFLGSLIGVKGPHLLLEAWGLVSPELRARGSLVLYGPSQHEPEYVARVEALAREVGARIGGRLERAEVARAHASIDLIVVPSVWFENAPLVIYESLAAGTPLLVSDLGGMAELVEEGAGGWRFRTGDAADLASKLSGFLADRSPLDRIVATRPAVGTFEEHVDEVEALYRVLGA